MFLVLSSSACEIPPRLLTSHSTLVTAVGYVLHRVCIHRALAHAACGCLQFTLFAVRLGATNIGSRERPASTAGRLARAASSSFGPCVRISVDITISIFFAACTSHALSVK